MKLKLIHRDKISLDLFEEHPVWAEYYEPNDEERMIQDGFEQADVQSELQRVGYSDYYLIPYINYQRPSPYEFTMYKAKIRVCGNTEFSGALFVTGGSATSVTVFAGGGCFVINLTDSDFSEEDDLCNVIGVTSIYPLEVFCDVGFKFNELYHSREKIS